MVWSPELGLRKVYIHWECVFLSFVFGRVNDLKSVSIIIKEGKKEASQMQIALFTQHLPDSQLTVIHIFMLLPVFHVSKWQFTSPAR